MTDRVSGHLRDTRLAREVQPGLSDQRLAVAKDTSQKGSRLAQLYLDRCFRLSAGDYSSVQALDVEIESLESQE